MNEDELEYRGTNDSILAPIANNQQDVADKSAIERCLSLLDARIASLDSVDNLSVDDTVFSIEQQVVINQRVKVIASELKAELSEAIENMKG